MINQSNYQIFLIALVPYIIICIILAAIGKGRGQSFMLVFLVSFFTGWVIGIFLVLAAKGKRAFIRDWFVISLLAILLYSCGDNPVNNSNNNPPPLIDTNIPPAPILLLPHDGDTAVSIMPFFHWRNNGDTLQIDENAAFITPFSFKVFDSSYVSNSPLNTNTWYYWRVGAKGNIQDSIFMVWSENIYHFKTAF